jgi:uncharacterized membrane protein YphA (DoxX/SURF4 family)
MSFATRDKWIDNARWFCCIAVAGVFLLAGWPKLVDPAAFADSIANFGLPNEIWNLSAAIIPPLEIFAAIALVIPSTRRTGGLLIQILLVCFTLLLASVILRGIDISCGCFGKSNPTDTVSWLDVGRNIGLFLLTRFGSTSPR